MIRPCSQNEALHLLVAELERDIERLCGEPEQLKNRIEALDRLDAFPDLTDRAALELRSRMEAANLDVFAAIRNEIQHGDQRASAFARWIDDAADAPVAGPEYDYLDELVSGVLQFDEPGDVQCRLSPEMVPYQPTPARHVFDLVGRLGLEAGDGFVDFGSGLGHVPLLAAILTNASCSGVEIEPSYVAVAKSCAQGLHLRNVQFIERDAREASFEEVSVFYLYTPFTGAMLDSVLESIRQHAKRRAIRVCSFGPCTARIAGEAWLVATSATNSPGRVCIFNSRG